MSLDFINGYRPLHPGMGQAVAERTILRKKEDGSLETWGDVAARVSLGNALLCPNEADVYDERMLLQKHIANASLLMSGRHLQHGDENQPSRNMEVFTNCLRGSTLIPTMEYGTVRLDAIVNHAVTLISADGTPRTATINEHGIQRVYEYTFKQNTSGAGKYTKTVVATKNHRWFLADGSVTTELGINDVIAAAPITEVRDPMAVVHGLIFGDGSAHKRRVDTNSRPSQGRTYATIRVSKYDVVRDEIHQILDTAGYEYTTPKYASGDRVYYIGKMAFAKDLPHTRDPEYIAGFIYGWWLADGYKSLNHALEISTIQLDAVEWLRDYAAIAGYAVTSERVQNRAKGDGSYPNGKPLYTVRIRQGLTWKVINVRFVGEEMVYCPEEPITSGFVLANGLLTGNCSTAPASFLMFYLLLNGSGVGRTYDDDMILVDWDNAPNIRVVIDDNHPDYDNSAHESVRDARHKYGNDSKKVMWYQVQDSREGWAKALEMWELAAFEKVHRDKMLILDFSQVRPSGSPIGGMQNRPASGPVPLMNAFLKAASLKNAGLEPWRQAIYIDHYFAECVLVGGARRSARMSTKFWKDQSIIDFIEIKRPIEYSGMSPENVTEYRDSVEFPPSSFLWSSNNSVTVDQEFWDLLDIKRGTDEYNTDLAKHARRVWKRVVECSYGDGTGEPGIINVDKLVRNDEGWDDLTRGDYVGYWKYSLQDETEIMMSKLAKKAKKMNYNMITNPCGEIALNILGGYCVIADVVPFHTETLDEAEEAFRVATRALMRVNLMDSLYKREVARTNRIGVGMTGVHEFAWKFFQVGFKDLVNPDFVSYNEARMVHQDTINHDNPLVRSAAFWMTLNRFNHAVNDEAEAYAKILGVTPPHTRMTIKPAGTTSKLFGLSEGWHLPSMAFYLRWVQFRNDDPLIETYRKEGYPVRQLVQYHGTTIVGFPTAPTIASLGMGDKLVTAGDATPEDQYKWLSLGEQFYIHGVDSETLEPMKRNTGNQISYTLKYKPDTIDLKHLRDTMRRYQPVIRACTVMPQEDQSSYEYLPEEPVTKARYEAVIKDIQHVMEEDIGAEHVMCDGGACPIDFNTATKAAVSV